MIKRIAVVVGAAAAVATLGATTPAFAAPTGSTTVTFAITAGALNITVPATANIGSGAPGTQFSGQLGAVTVSDQRALLVSAWTTKVTSTAFTTGAASADETIPASAVSYASGPATATTGIGVFTPGQLTSALAVPLTSVAANAPTAFTKTLGIGNSTTTWNPTLVVNAPASAVGGTYTGTVTHSVA